MGWGKLTLGENAQKYEGQTLDLDGDMDISQGPTLYTMKLKNTNVTPKSYIPNIGC